MRGSRDHWSHNSGGSPETMGLVSALGEGGPLSPLLPLFRLVPRILLFCLPRGDCVVHRLSCPGGLGHARGTECQGGLAGPSPSIASPVPFGRTGWSPGRTGWSPGLMTPMRHTHHGWSPGLMTPMRHTHHGWSPGLMTPMRHTHHAPTHHGWSPGVGHLSPVTVAMGGWRVSLGGRMAGLPHVFASCPFALCLMSFKSLLPSQSRHPSQPLHPACMSFQLPSSLVSSSFPVSSSIRTSSSLLLASFP